MRAEKIYSVFVKELRVVARERRLLAIIIMQPIILVSVFGYAFSGEIKNVGVAVVDEDGSELSLKLVYALHSSDAFDIKYFVYSRSEAVELVKLGKVHSAIYIPRNFEREFRNGSASIEVYVDESNYNVAKSVIEGINAISSELSRSFFGGIRVEQRYVFTTKTRLIDFIAPAIIGVVTQMLGLILSSSSVAREKEEGTLELIFSTPLKSSELILGKFAAVTSIIMLDVFVVMAITHFAFDVEIRGNIFLLILAQLLFLTGSIGVGLAISAVSATQLQGIQASMLFALISIFLSGFFYPLESMPEGARMISYFVPLTYANIAFREVMIKGNGLEVVYPHIAILLLYTLVSISIAVTLLRKVVGGGRK
ncbi:ABC-2 type transporter [Ferroglobus placidus DSM 10642]|uniref:ABC-2 type transporter n=1 Tax=Ferroglobus placidus (strain DSM 10642 / AEDII12DO) TaxID=589924 RepID=D3RZK8_FERPA|nr:ABC transporter permease [Ferroglobus placidus]ADC65921.1 ABC-2 type transporter [Ferroglobus placidus DSM 10642]